jgi:hypothetical protein
MHPLEPVACARRHGTLSSLQSTDFIELPFVARSLQVIFGPARPNRL